MSGSSMLYALYVAGAYRETINLAAARGHESGTKTIVGLRAWAERRYGKEGLVEIVSLLEHVKRWEKGQKKPGRFKRGPQTKN